MTKHSQNTLYRASQLLSEAYDLDDPMNNFNDSTDFDSTAQLEMPAETSVEEEQSFEVDVANPVCPCCGARLNIVDSSESDDSGTIDGIEVMDASLEPASEEKDNNDTYVTLDDLSFDDEPASESEEEEDEEEDPDEESGEKVEAF